MSDDNLHNSQEPPQTTGFRKRISDLVGRVKTVVSDIRKPIGDEATVYQGTVFHGNTNTMAGDLVTPTE